MLRGLQQYMEVELCPWIYLKAGRGCQFTDSTSVLFERGLLIHGTQEDIVL
jgi:hypothetical protein